MNPRHRPGWSASYGPRDPGPPPRAGRRRRHPSRTRPATGSRLRALTDLAKALARVRWSDDVLTAVAGEARRALDADSLSLSQWEREAGWLRTLVNVGDLGPGEEPRPASEIYPVTAFPERWALLERGPPYVVRRAESGPPRSRLEQLLGETDKGSAVSAPVVVEGGSGAKLHAARRVGRAPYAESDVDFVTAVALQVAAGVGLVVEEGGGGVGGGGGPRGAVRSRATTPTRTRPRRPCWVWAGSARWSWSAAGTARPTVAGGGDIRRRVIGAGPSSRWRCGGSSPWRWPGRHTKITTLCRCGASNQGHPATVSQST